MRFYLFAVALFFLSNGIVGAVLSNSDIYHKIEPYVLKIEFLCSYTAYDEVPVSSGTGFWLGGDSNLIITNRHIASYSKPGTYYATDSQGQKIELNLVYTSPIVDLAYLEPAHEGFTRPEAPLEFNKSPKKNARIYMMGNNGGNGIVQQEGTISSLWTATRILNINKAITVGINAKGGSSGSPVLDEEGNLIGVNYAGGDSANFIVPVEFVEEDLSYLFQNLTPPKKDIGLCLDFIKISEAIDALGLNKEDINVAEYNQLYPNAQSNILKISTILPNSPAEGYFMPGDIITHVNDTPISADLFIYQKTMNESISEKVKISYIRFGEKKEDTIDLMDLNELACDDMIIWGKSILTKVDALQAYRTGMKLGSIGIFNNPLGSIFPGLSFKLVTETTSQIIIKSIAGSDIKTLDDAEESIAQINKDAIWIVYENYGFKSLANRIDSNRGPFGMKIVYNPQIHQMPTRIHFNHQNHKWENKKISVIDQKK